MHAIQVVHAPFQLIDGFHGLVGRAALCRRLDHHHQNIGAGGVVLDDELVVEVIARIGTQLRRARVQVADSNVLAVVDTEGKGTNGQHNGDRRNCRVSKAGDRQPQLLRAVGQVAVALDGATADTDVGHQNRQQHQVGQDDDTHTNRGSDTQLTNNLDLDQQQGHKTHSIRDQRHDARNVKGTESTTGSGLRVIGTGIFNRHTVDDLHAVGDTDSEDQERHQNRVRVQTKAQCAQQAKLPYHRNHRADQCGQRALEAAGKDQQQHKGDQQRSTEEHHDLDDAVDQVTDLFGKTNNVDLDVRVFALELGTNLLFQLTGEIAVIQLDQLTLVFRVGIGFLQRDIDDGRLEVVGNQAADFTGLEYVFTQLV